jgi:hypothetical protein
MQYVNKKFAFEIKAMYECIFHINKYTIFTGQLLSDQFLKFASWSFIFRPVF